MAIVLDAARPIDGSPTYAMDKFTQPTPRQVDMNQGWDVYSSLVETHVGFAYEAPVNNTADNNAPQVDYENAPFWLPSTPKTVR